MNTRQFEHFIAVMESGSFMHASRSLNLSQPALSKSIRTLEEIYGVPLFRRMPRGVQPTAFARTLEPHARRTIRDIEQSRAAMAAFAAGSAGHLSVGCGPSFAGIVAETIEDLHGRASDIQFTVLTDHADNLRRALLGNRIECFIGMANKAIGDENLEVQSLFNDDFVGICGPDHPFAGRTVDVVELKEHEWIMANLEEPARVALEAYFLTHLEQRPRVRLTTNADVVMRRFLDRSDCLGLTFQMNTGLQAFAGLAQFRLEGFGFQRRVGIVSRAHTPATPLRDRFVGLLAESVEAAFNLVTGPQKSGSICSVSMSIY